MHEVTVQPRNVADTLSGARCHPVVDTGCTEQGPKGSVYGPTTGKQPPRAPGIVDEMAVGDVSRVSLADFLRPQRPPERFHTSNQWIIQKSTSLL
jgi:hypothetical protein